MGRYNRISRIPERIAVISAVILISLLMILSSACSSPYIQDESEKPTLNIPETPAPDTGIRDPENASGNIVMGLCELDTLDPMRSQNEAVRKYMTLVYDSLVHPGVDASPEPCVAADWNTEDGGTTWLFLLRDDVYFHDGSQLTAYDVKNTIEWIVQNGGTYEACVSGISGVNIVSRHSLEIVMSAPDAFLPAKMIFPIIKSEDTVSFTLPNGTGKYKYASYDGSSYKFTLNSEYFGEIPMIASLEIRNYESRDALYNSGADVMLFFEDNTVRYGALDGYAYCEYADNVFTCLLPSSKTDISVRKYVSSVLDRRVIVNSVIAGKGTKKLFPIAEGTFYRTHADEFPSDIQGFAPQSVNIIVNSSDRDLVRLSSVIKDTLSDCGIDCLVAEYASDEYRNIVLYGDYDFALMNLQMSSWPDLYELFASDGSLNYNGYADESMDSLLVSIRNAYRDSDTSGVLDLESFSNYAKTQLDKISARAGETLPVIGLYSKNASVYVKKTVSGVQQYNFTFWNTMDQFVSWHIDTQEAGAEG